ncbi:uncharacterized protein LOC135931989 isoform X2 [Gordionus sp. m RMFG-2023]|uniref:uncharacterized protein LOC135931989 isoform X2 n=1 Tax=Gordionus sp. m RMFG-2023 TaxID=3053472 RepID=UPI0031FCB1E9
MYPKLNNSQKVLLYFLLNFQILYLNALLFLDTTIIKEQPGSCKIRACPQCESLVIDRDANDCIICYCYKFASNILEWGLATNITSTKFPIILFIPDQYSYVNLNVSNARLRFIQKSLINSTINFSNNRMTNPVTNGTNQIQILKVTDANPTLNISINFLSMNATISGKNNKNDNKLATYVNVIPSNDLFSLWIGIRNSCLGNILPYLISNSIISGIDWFNKNMSCFIKPDKKSSANSIQTFLAQDVKSMNITNCGFHSMLSQSIPIPSLNYDRNGKEDEYKSKNQDRDVCYLSMSNNVYYSPGSALNMHLNGKITGTPQLIENIMFAKIGQMVSLVCIPTNASYFAYWESKSLETKSPLIFKKITCQDTGLHVCHIKNSLFILDYNSHSILSVIIYIENCALSQNFRIAKIIQVGSYSLIPYSMIIIASLCLLGLIIITGVLINKLFRHNSLGKNNPQLHKLYKDNPSNPINKGNNSNATLKDSTINIKNTKIDPNKSSRINLLETDFSKQAHVINSDDIIINKSNNNQNMNQKSYIVKLRNNSRIQPSNIKLNSDLGKIGLYDYGNLTPFDHNLSILFTPFSDIKDVKNFQCHQFWDYNDIPTDFKYIDFFNLNYIYEKYVKFPTINKTRKGSGENFLNTIYDEKRNSLNVPYELINLTSISDNKSFKFSIHSTTYSNYDTLRAFKKIDNYDYYRITFVEPSIFNVFEKNAPNLDVLTTLPMVEDQNLQNLVYQCPQAIDEKHTTYKSLSGKFGILNNIKKNTKWNKNTIYSFYKKRINYTILVNAKFLSANFIKNYIRLSYDNLICLKVYAKIQLNYKNILCELDGHSMKDSFIYYNRLKNIFYSDQLLVNNHLKCMNIYFPNNLCEFGMDTMLSLKRINNVHDSIKRNRLKNMKILSPFKFNYFFGKRWKILDCSFFKFDLKNKLCFMETCNKNEILRIMNNITVLKSIKFHDNDEPNNAITTKYSCIKPKYIHKQDIGIKLYNTEVKNYKLEQHIVITERVTVTRNLERNARF